MEPLIASQMTKVVEAFSHNLGKLNLGRASSQLVEDIMVDYYGQRLPLKQMASIAISSPEAILVTPWDKNSLGDIYNGVLNSGLNLSPVNDGQHIRVNLPPLSQERRQELVKIIHRQLEEARIALRNIREEAWRDSQHQKQKKEISEDAFYRQEKELNKSIEDFNCQLQAIADGKEKQILS
ncbi:MAG: ribosome recycling factor [Candidatus Berkelbacteria bacterium Licking1014_2]|uniref:Ribosome recycling factor n=1 Tax=Candidatus Berkelbacteria bacterium Licking1014_2 TaxID=2017146 RepID=A0A554LX09_9BACT|nr:MAG: ribosome recycling factor [Candidatus Berkelbacteria bacterium Licking1014_2]